MKQREKKGENQEIRKSDEIKTRKRCAERRKARKKNERQERRK